MRIDEIHIYGFGKFRDFKLNFADNFNLIFGENENGKTTICEFIKMMFYGNRPRNNDPFTNPRTKYRPLDGGVMAGSISFLHNDTRYRLEREFKGSNATDKITLYNLDLGNSTSLSGKDEVGERFFSLNYGAFEKTMFIANSVGFQSDAAADGTINARLSNINTTGDEDVSYEAVIKRINAAMEEIKTPTGRGGSLVKLGATLSALDNEAAEQKVLAKRREELQKEIEQSEENLTELGNKKHVLFEKLKNAEKFEIKTKLEEFIKIAEDYEKIEKQITLASGEIATKDFCEKFDLLIDNFEKLNDKCASLLDEVNRLTDDVAVLEQVAGGNDNVEALKQELNTINTNIDSLERQQDALELQKLRLEERLNNTKAKINLPLIISGTLLLLGGAIGGVIASPYVFGAMAIGLVLFILSFVLKKKPITKDIQSELTITLKDVENKNREIESFKQKAQSITLKINELTVKSETGKSLLNEKKTQVLEKRTELLSLQNKTAEAKKEMLEWANTLGTITDAPTAKQLLSETESKLQELARLQVAAEYAAKGTNCKNLAEAKEKLSFISLSENVPETTLDAIREELKQITENHQEVSRELAALKAEARTAFSGLKAPAELLREKNELLEVISEQNEYYDDLSLALEGLTAAFGEIRRSFSGVLENRALELLSGITNGKYDSINVSKNFDITVSDRDNFGLHGLEHLSKGAMHQAYFSLRLALSELMGKDAGGLPIILDDAFSQYDDKRLLKALGFLGGYAASEQVIFFTCHNDCRAAAESIGAKIINL